MISILFSIFNIRSPTSISFDDGPRSFQETMDMVLKGIPIPCKIVENKFNDHTLSIATKEPVKKPWEQNDQDSCGH